MPADIQQKIQNMLDEIPDNVHAGEKHREHSLSKTSARWLANMMLMIVENSGCNNGFSADEASSLKAVAAERKKMIALLGAGFMALLVYFGNMLLHLLDKAHWKAFFSKIGGS